MPHGGQPFASRVLGQGLSPLVQKMGHAGGQAFPSFPVYEK